MSFPVFIHLGPFTIHPHLLFELLAYGVGFRIFLHLRKGTTDPLDETQRVIVIIGAAAGALIGSKFLGLLESERFWGAPHLTLADLLSFKTILGGLLGGIVGVELTKKIARIHHSTGDLFTLPLIAGIAIGRIGCFLTGLEDGTTGLPTSLPWGVNFGDEVARHPTALYEIVFLCILAVVLTLLRGQARQIPGMRFRIFVSAYCLFRLCGDALKPHYKLALNLSAIQISSLLGLLIYLALIYSGYRKSCRTPGVIEPL